MPTVGQRVVVTAETSSKYGQTGKLVSRNGSEGRPFIVEFRDGTSLKFRQGDVYKPSQVQWV